MILAIEGLPVEVVYRGQTAIEVADRWRADLVVLDICMPDLSGLQVASRLRQQATTDAVVIIGHSALSAERDYEQARLIGFDAYCAKPLDPSRLVPLVRFLCDKTQ
jgi:DNA-binding response OmpR family regulator